MERKRLKRLLGGFTAALALLLGTAFSAASVRAESGTVYTCVIHPCYAHPVTGVIEDSGGEASYATGQGMAESAVNTAGILEVTDSGSYYLTIRLSLMDYTGNHSFWVQSAGASDWTAPALGVTGSGTDSSGETADVCIQVPNENCVIRVSMYVQPMGRDVIFYLYPSDFTAGNSTDLNATMVTAASGTDVQNDEEGAEAANPAPTAAAEPAQTAEDAGTPAPTAAPESTETPAATPTPQNQAEELQNSITEAAAPESESSGDETLDKAQGLSLSTEGEETGGKTITEETQGSRIAEYIISRTLTGLILLAAGSGVVYLFRKNWKKWGGGYEDDGDEEEE